MYVRSHDVCPVCRGPRLLCTLSCELPVHGPDFEAERSRLVVFHGPVTARCISYMHSLVEMIFGCCPAIMPIGFPLVSLPRRGKPTSPSNAPKSGGDAILRSATALSAGRDAVPLPGSDAANEEGNGVDAGNVETVFSSDYYSPDALTTCLAFHGLIARIKGEAHTRLVADGSVADDLRLPVEPLASHDEGSRPRGLASHSQAHNVADRAVGPGIALCSLSN